MNEKDIKRTIKLLRKLKRQAKVGTEERRDINRKIRRKKQELEDLYKSKSDNPLIQKIYELRPEYRDLKIDLRKFTNRQLEYHYRKILKKESK